MTDLFEAICNVLINHRKPGSTAHQTLHRVVAKAMAMAWSDDIPPLLTPQNTAIRLETRSPQDLIPLVVRPPRLVSNSIKGIGKKARHYIDCPVIVLEHGEREYLLDGNRRVLHLVEIGHPTVEVYVCRLI